tara:strand:+ start:670 stop:864 length:195 start_codon:yes stop_codon:yes gene_type:complete
MAEQDFRVVTMQDIIELRDAVYDWQQNTGRAPDFNNPNSNKATELINRTHELLNNMVKSKGRHS